MKAARTASWVLLSLLSVGACSGPPKEVLAPIGDPPEARFPSTYFEYTSVLQGEPLEHTFTVRNIGGTNLQLLTVEPGPRVEVLEFDRVVGRGKEGIIRLRLSTDHAKGKTITGVVVKTNDPNKADHRLALMGKVVPTVEVGPQEHAYIFDILQGHSGTKELTLTNHQATPLEVLGTEIDNELFSTTIEELDPGQKYRLVVNLDSSAGVGKHQGTLILTTDSPDHSAIPIPLLATVQQRIFARPEEVIFGKFYRRDLGRRVVAEREVQVVRLAGTGALTVRVLSSDLSFLSIDVAEASTEDPKLTVRLRADELPSGAFDGTIILGLDDPEFPELALPVRGEVVLGPSGTPPPEGDEVPATPRQQDS